MVNRFSLASVSLILETPKPFCHVFNFDSVYLMQLFSDFIAPHKGDHI